MTKQDILNMKNGREIIKAMLENTHLVDSEVAEHQKAVSQREYIEKYGSLDVHFDPLRKKSIL